MDGRVLPSPLIRRERERDRGTQKRQKLAAPLLASHGWVIVDCEYNRQLASSREPSPAAENQNGPFARASIAATGIHRSGMIGGPVLLWLSLALALRNSPHLACAASCPVGRVGTRHVTMRCDDAAEQVRRAGRAKTNCVEWPPSLLGLLLQLHLTTERQARQLHTAGTARLTGRRRRGCSVRSCRELSVTEMTAQCDDGCCGRCCCVRCSHMRRSAISARVEFVRGLVSVARHRARREGSAG